MPRVDSFQSDTKFCQQYLLTAGQMLLIPAIFLYLWWHCRLEAQQFMKQRGKSGDKRQYCNRGACFGYFWRLCPQLDFVPESHQPNINPPRNCLPLSYSSTVGFRHYVKSLLTRLRCRKRTESGQCHWESWIYHRMGPITGRCWESRCKLMEAHKATHNESFAYNF